MRRRDVLLALGAAATGARVRAIEEAAVIEGKLTQLTEAGGGDNRATYMPDGKTMLFASMRSGKSQIFAMDADGGAAHRFHESQANDYGRVAPSPDGKQICFSSDRSGENGIYVLELKSGVAAPVSDLTQWSFGPTWSSRNLIAYFSRKGGNKINTWTVRPDGSEARQITNRPGESRQPWWLPDGRALALSADNGSGAFQIWLMTDDDTDARAITTNGDWQQPFPSPDGKRIAVSAKLDSGAFRILVITVDGSGARAIAQPDNVNNVHPAWSPDGRSILFTSGDGKAGALWRFAFA